MPEGMVNALFFFLKKKKKKLVGTGKKRVKEIQRFLIRKYILKQTIKIQTIVKLKSCIVCIMRCSVYMYEVACLERVLKKSLRAETWKELKKYILYL